MPSIMLKLQDVFPNPFRDLKSNPLHQKKITALVESIDATGYWENIEGRISDGKFQIAYGHHRLEALKIKHKGEPDRTFEFKARELSDSDMIQRMIRENNETYGSDLCFVIESVRATVAAVAEGRVILPPVTDDVIRRLPETVRNAPSFMSGKVRGENPSYPYTTNTLAVFTGCTESDGRGGVKANDKLTAALAYLENEELGIVGWNAKALDTFRKPDGSIPVSEVLKAARSAQTRQSVMLAREKEKAAVVREAGKSLQQKLKEAEDHRKEIAAEEEAEAKRRAKALTEKQAEQKEKDRVEREQRKAEADEKVKQAAADWKANQAERAKQKKQEEARKVKAVADVEASRVARVRTLIEKVDRVLDADALAEELKKPPVMNPAERKMLKKALSEAAGRFDKAAGKY